MTIKEFLSLPYYNRKYVTFISNDAYERIEQQRIRSTNSPYDEAMRNALKSISGELNYSKIASILLLPTASAIVLTPTLIEIFLGYLSRKRQKDDLVLIIPRSFSSHLKLPPSHPLDQNFVYVAHPTDPNTYLPISEFHRFVFEDKCKELLNILTYLGAKSITIRHVHGWSDNITIKLGANIPNASMDAGGGKQSDRQSKILYTAKLNNTRKPALPSQLAWYHHESLWQAMATMRLKGGLTEFQVDLEYSDDFGINATLKSRINKIGMNVGGNFVEHQSTVWHFEGTF